MFVCVCTGACVCLRVLDSHLRRDRFQRVHARASSRAPSVTEQTQITAMLQILSGSALDAAAAPVVPLPSP